MTRINVVFEDVLADELRCLVPNRQRSQFIAAAVQERLSLLKQVKAVQATAGSWSSEGRADPEEEIRGLRNAWAERTERLEG